MRNWSVIVHTPPPFAKMIIIAMVLLNQHFVSSTISLGKSATLGNSERGQLLLFCCFFNIFSLHIPSFIWNHKVNIPLSIAMLEHILHYYFILAFILVLIKYHFPPITQEMELIISTQMCFYFLWHIFHEMKRQELHFKRRCTLFPNVIETSVYIFALLITPFFWTSNSPPLVEKEWQSQEEGSNIRNISEIYFNHNTGQAIPPYLFHSFLIFSTLLLSEIASVLFEYFENIYSIFIASEEGNTFLNAIFKKER